MMEAREILKEIVACVKELVEPSAALAQNVRGHAMQLLALSQFHGATNNRRMREFDIGIEKKNVSAVGVSCAQVAADGRHSAADYADVEAVAEAENDFGRAVG
jgi:hypothetical protein